MSHKNNHPSARYQLAILGQGSAAFAAAIKANELGIKTVMIGKNETKGAVVGGTCVNVGCVPSKNLLTVGNIFREIEGFEPPFASIKYGTSKVDFKKAIEEKDVLVKKFRRQKYSDVLKSLENVDYFPELGQFVSSTEVKTQKRTINSDKFLIATGARADVGAIAELDRNVEYLTNEEALGLETLPESLIVIGGRALGLEFAQMYSHFGSKVTVLQRTERILPDEEPEISVALRHYLEEDGIAIHTSARILRISQIGKIKIVKAIIHGKTMEFRARQLLLATGRIPNTEYLSPEKAGVELGEEGFIRVDNEMRTSAPNIWAAGDVTGKPMLEALAAKEGAISVNNAFSGVATKKTINFKEVPSAVFTSPEVARVGLTEVEAHQGGIKCNCGVLPLEYIPKAQIIGDTRGLIKMVVDWDSKKIIGVHLLAPHAADLIHEGVLAVKLGLTIDDII